MDLAIQIQVEELPEGVFLATSDELPGWWRRGVPLLRRCILPATWRGN